MIQSTAEFSKTDVEDTAEKAPIRILHVDDDTGFLKTAKQCLEVQGHFRMDTASSVDEAMEKMKKEKYDVVVCDYQMPGKDGLQFLKELRQKGNSIPFIIFTGKGREEVAIKALNLGADGYFNKAGDSDTVYGELAHGIHLIVERNRAQEMLEQSNHSLATLNAVSIELASLPSDVIIEEFLAKRLREITGAAAVSFADYETGDQILVGKFLEVESGMQEKFTGLLGKSLGDIRCPVSEEAYREICSSVIGKRQTLTEAAYGGIPPSVGVEVQKLLRVDRFIGVAYIIEGELYGTSLLAIKAGSPDPPREMLESFGHMAAVSLRRRRAEEALRESEEKYRSLLQDSGLKIGYYDLQGNILMMNKKGQEDLNRPLEEIAGKSVYEVFGKDIGDIIIRRIGEIAKSKEAKSYEDFVELPAGKKWFLSTYSGIGDGKGQISGVQVISIDTSERKSAEEALRDSEEKFKRIFESANDGLIYLDAFGRILDANGKALEIFGGAKEEVLGKHFTKIGIFSPKEIPILMRNFAGVMEGKKTVIEYAIKNKNGKVIPLECSASLLKSDNESMIAVVARDSSERKKTLEKLQILNEKLGVVGGLTRHDVRNKLFTVINNVYLAKQLLPDDHKALAYLREIESACGQTTRILDFAATYESLGVEQLALVDMGKAVEEAASLFSDLQGVKVVNECHGLGVMADSLLRQLFYNLFDNSLKHGEKVSRISVHYQEGKDGLRLLYEDDGVGIPKAIKPKIFAEGFTTDKGFGHGLPLVKRMLEVYGWTIEEEGKSGKGVKFVITIPRTNSNGKENYQLS
jgi:PAS domain S-box-containing protein